MTAPEIFVAPDVEEIAIDHLGGFQLPGVQVATFIPKPIPKADGFVVPKSAGGLGRRSTVLEERMLVVDCYSWDEVAAHRLADVVHGIMLIMNVRPEIYRVSTFGGPYHQVDPLYSDLSRYTINLNVLVRAAAWTP